MPTFPSLRKKPDMMVRAKSTHVAQTRMAPDKNPKTKGVELRAIQLIVDAAENILRGSETIESVEIRVRFVDRNTDPSLLLDIQKIMNESQKQLVRRIDDLSKRIERLFVFELGNGEVVADVKLEPASSD